MTTVNKTRQPRLLSLCSGIGGIDLAWEMAGGEIAGQCELDDYCQRVLARHWPDVKRVADIRSVWGDSFDGPIDLVAGGIPCQPWSVAGKRRGHADDRHLWPEMRRIIEIYQPAWVLIENVAGFARLALDGVLADLGADGYEASAVMVPAAASGAPHLRERIFVVAHATHCQRAGESDVTDPQGTLERTRVGASRGIERGRLAARVSDERRIERNGAPDVADADQHGRRWAQRAERGDMAGASPADAGDERHLQRLAAQCGRPDGRDGMAHADGQRRAQGDAAQRNAARQSDCRAAQDTGDGQAVTCGAGLEGRGPGRSTGQPGASQSRMGRDADGLSRRLDGAGLMPPRHAWPAGPGQSQHVWEPPRTTQERRPIRAARLKALGNAVCPQQVYPVLAAIIAVWRVDCR